MSAAAAIMTVQSIPATAAPTFTLTSVFDLASIVPPGAQLENLRVTSDGLPVAVALPVVPGLWVYDLNSAGVAVGTCMGTGFGASFGGCTYSLATGILAIPFTLPQPGPGQAVASDAYDINEHGDVLGGPTSVNNGNSNIELQIVMAGGTRLDLGVSSYRRPVFNNALEVLLNSMQGGVTYYENGSQTPLDSMVSNLDGFRILQATDINDTGYITGLGRDSLGEWRGFVLSQNSVPEPATLALIGIALVGLTATQRRQARKASCRQESA